MAAPTGDAGQREEAEVSVLVTNTGSRPGSHVVQVYAAREDGPFDDTVRALLGFARLDLDAGEARRISVRACLRPLQRRHADGWAAPSGTYRVEAAAHCGDPAAAVVRVVLSGAGFPPEAC
ncbi:fibronectin type III-like domain-contianing protein [Streptomyces sp. NPDC021224]|uniref:fibronectin type III-like domain-contianing protein n=1 Tax=unclassified Streptomyces TaxID=2593676 RepID=UPI00378CB02F